MSTAPATWRKRYPRASVDIDLDDADFTPEDFLQALINSKWLSETEALAIKMRAGKKETVKFDGDAFLVDELVIAEDELRSGRTVEAKIHLERALGRHWTGVLA